MPNKGASLAGKVAIVTGGARGIGAAIGRRYALEGARVVVADVLREEAEATAKLIGGDAFAVGFDGTDLASITDLIDKTVDRAGRVDCLVNGAAVFDMAPFLDVTEASFDRLISINVKGLLFTAQAAARQMVKQGHGGKIINIASQAGRRGEALVSVYCATKAAVISLTQSMGLALIKQRINVNGIAPGVIDTPMWAEVDALFARHEKKAIGQKKREVGEAVPFGRMGRPDDLAGAAVFLASDDSDYIVAQTL
ncbi:MAG: L-iditol 2-dehydrogenase, partial [Geminicoccaceae bacterium]